MNQFLSVPLGKEIGVKHHFSETNKCEANLANQCL